MKNKKNLKSLLCRLTRIKRKKEKKKKVLENKKSFFGIKIKWPAYKKTKIFWMKRMMPLVPNEISKSLTRIKIVKKKKKKNIFNSFQNCMALFF